MKDYKIGFIGMGNMAYSIAKGILHAHFLKGKNVCGFDPYPAKLNTLHEAFGVQVAKSIPALVQNSDVILLAVKPNMVQAVLEEAGDALQGKAIISIALGWQFAELEKVVGNNVRIQAVMPNTPMEVGEGVCLFEEKNTLQADEQTFLKNMFESIGKVQVLPTYLMGVGGTLSGCGPAFVYMMIEALADGAVKNGLARKDAYMLAAQMMKGSAEMVLETGKHPGELKDNVCSPGGSTIRGVAKLEEKGLRDALISAIDASTNG